ncbi:MAG: PspA/IM30 family protein [Cyanobacteria bacterium P01_F01_bin.42]
MGLLNRVGRLIRASLNSLLSQAEDPEKVLEQTVMEMQEDLIALRQAVAQAIATQKRTERQQAAAQAQAKSWYNRAQLALGKGDDDLARDALTRRQTYVDTAKTLGMQLTQQQTTISQLKQNLRTLESKIAEAKAKKDLYIARARSAQASQQINEMMGRVGTNTAVNAFERMEERVNQLEAQSTALGELNAELNADSLEQRFLSLEGGGAVEAELAAMKQQLEGGTSSSRPPQSLDDQAKS